MAEGVTITWKWEGEEGDRGTAVAISPLVNRALLATCSIDRVPKWAWLQVAVTPRAVASVCRAKNGSVNGKFIQRRGCELAAERYHEAHLKSL